MKLSLGTLRTVMLQDHSSPTEKIGVFELPVEIDQDLFMKDPDKFGMCKAAISQHLASAVRDTKVPTTDWQFVSTDFMIKNYQFPAVMSFDRRR